MYDAIVIGSGIGSLTTAGLLARAAGARASSSNNTRPPAASPTRSGDWEPPGTSACTTWETWNPARARDNSWTTSPEEPHMEPHARRLRPLLPARPRPRRHNSRRRRRVPTPPHLALPPRKDSHSPLLQGREARLFLDVTALRPRDGAPARGPAVRLAHARSQATRSNGRSTTWNADSATPRCAPS